MYNYENHPQEVYYHDHRSIYNDITHHVTVGYQVTNRWGNDYFYCKVRRSLSIFIAEPTFATSLIHECNELIACSMRCVEPKEALQAFSDFFALTSRKIHIVGPLVPLTKRSEEAKQKQTAKSPEIAEFMQNALRTHGERSMIYVRPQYALRRYK